MRFDTGFGRIHSFVFDLDDTLYPEAEYVKSGLDAVGKWLLEERGLAGFSKAAEAIFLRGVRGRIFDVALEQLGFVADQGLIALLIDVYRSHQPSIRLYQDAAELLEILTGHVNLALITDGYAETQVRKIEALGLQSRFAECIITDALGRAFWKPHPEAFRRVMARFQGLPSGFVYVGDNEAKDFVSPRALGWRTICINRPNSEYRNSASEIGEEPELKLSSIAKLIQRLRLSK